MECAGCAGVRVADSELILVPNLFAWLTTFIESI